MSERIKISDTLTEWRYTLRAAKQSAHTIKGYLSSVSQFVSFLEGAGLSTIIPEIQARHCRMFLAHLFELGRADTTVLTRWAGLRAYFNFVREAEILDGPSPMLDVAKPKIESKVIPEVPADNIRALMNSCDRKTFRGARDYAIMRLLTRGLRRGEIAGIMLNDLDLNDDATVVVHGKGSKQRRVSLSPKDVIAITTYIRQRRKYVDSCPSSHPAVGLPNLFVSKWGAFTGAGIEKMLNRKCEELGIKRANAHAWRHTWAGEWKAQGGSDEGLMAQGGWSTNREIRRYTAHNRERSSIQEAQRLSIGDNL
jgi:site-specific recombinase XerD